MPYLVALVILFIVIAVVIDIVSGILQTSSHLVVVYGVNIILAILPAVVAHNKKRKWWLWLLYGLFLWPIAMIHVLFVDREKFGWIGEKKGKEAIAQNDAIQNGQVGFTSDATNKIKNMFDDSKSADELLAELNNLTGLTNVKNHLRGLFNQLAAEKERRRRKISSEGLGSIHMVFTGNPGTGKTTVARLIAAIYKKMGIVKTGAFVEADRSSLVAEYIGQTEQLTKEKIREAWGGVLFIDEAYALYHEDDPRDFGREAITTLLKAMEDNRNNLVVIVAGYTDEMNKFLSSDPGLESRFAIRIEFEDYKPQELMDIFMSMCEKNGFILANDAYDKLLSHFVNLYDNRGKNFGNARTVRNIFEKLRRAQSNRIARYGDISSQSNEALMTITCDDVNAVLQEKGALDV